MIVKGFLKFFQKEKAARAEIIGRLLQDISFRRLNYQKAGVYMDKDIRREIDRDLTDRPSESTGKKAPKQPNPLYLEIGKRIKKARETAHVTQEQLAENISVSSKQYISDLERGMVGASVPTIIKICDSLHASADYILLGVTSENAYSDTNRKIREMPSDQQAMIDRGL